jgi:hypothetical protein
LFLLSLEYSEKLPPCIPGVCQKQLQSAHGNLLCESLTNFRFSDKHMTLFMVEAFTPWKLSSAIHKDFFILEIWYLLIIYQHSTALNTSIPFYSCFVLIKSCHQITTHLKYSNKLN